MSSNTYAPYLPRLLHDWPGSEPFQELEGTLVSVDLSGFTSLSERLQAKGRAGAEELVLAVSGVFQGLIGIGERRGGDVLKFRGDALLLFFSDAGHESRACRAASEMQWLLGEIGTVTSSVGTVQLQMSTGIYTGTCQFFLVDGSHRELVVAGPAATATIALENAADAGDILVSDRTAESLDRAWVGEAKAGARLLRPLPSAGDDDEPAVVAHAALAGDLEPFIPVPLRTQLLLEQGEAEHRRVTAAFLKFSGVGAIVETEGAEGLHARIDELAGIVGFQARELGLTWLESDIDVDAGKLYLVGGAPSSTGADEDRMLRALRSIMNEFDGLVLRAGVNRGPAFCGDIGAFTRRTYAVMGDTVNLAARLTARAEPGGILATADVLDRAHVRFDTSMQPFLMKGKERPITAYHVGEALGEKEDEQHVELPFVGRDDEVAALASAIDRARVRQQQFVELVGEAGIGKSRLVNELQRRALGFTQLVGRCDQYSTTTAYAVFQSLLRPLTGLTPDADAASAGAHLVPWLEAVMPDLAPVLPLLALVFGADVPATPETEALDPQFRRARLHEAVSKLLERVLMMPTLVVLEDTHWIDDASRELLRHLTGTDASRPWLIATTSRPQAERLAHAEIDGHTQLLLEPVSSDAAETLALAAAGSAAYSPDVLQALVDRAGGNPLYIRELVAAARGTADVDLLPDSIETLILTRLDTLAPADRFLLRNASVLGSTIDVDLLGEVLAAELSDVTDLARWEPLSEFIVWEDARELRFQHDLFRSAAYEGLSFKRRREMHHRVARALEARAGSSSDQVAALLSLHYHRAGSWEAAWRYAVAAAEHARERTATVEAVELYGRALDVADETAATPDEIAGVAEALGDVAELAGKYDQAEVAYRRAQELVPDDLITQTHLLRKLGVLAERTGHYDDALSWYTRASSALDAVKPSREKTRSRADLALAYAGTRYRQGRFDEALQWSLDAAENARAGDDRTRLAHAYYLTHISSLRLGRHDEQIRDEALAILEEVGDYARLTNLQNNVGIEAYFDGRWSDAIDWYRRGRESAQRVGDIVGVARGVNNEAEILSDQGHLTEAKPLFDEALRVWRSASYRLGVALATANLGRLAARRASFDEAHRLLQEALDAFRELGAREFVVETETRIAECLVFEGRQNDAAAALAPLLAEEPTSMAFRLAGYAKIQSRAPFAEARPDFDAALESARAAQAPYEIALALQALANLGGEDGAEADAILARLGVVSTPRIPLP